jgi:hypothetical protein
MDRYPIHIYGQGTRLVLSLNNYDFRRDLRKSIWRILRFPLIELQMERLASEFRLNSRTKSPFMTEKQVDSNR